MSGRFPVVLVDDGELDEIRDLLAELGVEFAHLRGGAVPRRLEPPRDLFIATMRRASLARTWPHSPDGSLRPVRIAVVDEDSPAARSALRKLGFGFLVRHPVHPVALRLLVLRALYEGEERRVDARVPVGVDVTLRTGLRRRDALLADLSRGGCRLVTDRALPAGAKITLHLPSELLGESDLALGGQILRCERDAQALPDGGFQVAVRFQPLRDGDRQRLERFLLRRDVRLGPAAEPTVQPLRPARAPAPTPEPERRPASVVAAPEPAPPIPGPERPARAAEPERAGNGLAALIAQDARRAAANEPPRAAPPAAPPRLGAALIGRHGSRRGPPPDRRRHGRAVYDRRIVAEAASAMHRMLFGRDLAVGGMRVDAHPDLRVGARLRVALYDPAREAPLVVDAVVCRDDGERGFGLQFLAVKPDVAARLETLVAGLPPVERLTDGESASLGTVVGEIVP